MAKGKKITDIPELMKEWDYEKNREIGLVIESFTTGTHTKAYWKCSEGHSWYASIANRARLGRSCPYCAHQLPITGETDFASTNPELMKEWDYELNKRLEPTLLMPGTHKKAYWKCSEGHSWRAEIKSRVSGIGCPYCAGKFVIRGVNDLASVKPDLAAEWDYEKNGILTPSEVTKRTAKKVWWRCKNGHSFYASVSNRVAGRGCFKCISMMRTSFPEQAVFYYIKQLYPDAINGYKGIFTGSMELDIYIPSIKLGIEYDGKVYHGEKLNIIRDSKKYKICCDNGIKLVRIVEKDKCNLVINCHKKIEILEYDTDGLNYAIVQLLAFLRKSIDVDVNRDRKAIQSYLDKRKISLLEDNPDVAAEWNYEKNYPLVPENFAPASNEKVWWKCQKCAHEWEARINDRTRKDNTGCPQCARNIGAKKRVKTLIKKIGSALDLPKNILSEWDYEHNVVMPSELVMTSTKKVLWKCSKCGFVWKCSPGKRYSGSGCPACQNLVVLPQNSLASLRPELLQDWDFSKNTILPGEVALGNGKFAYWKCHICGHEWRSRIYSRAKGVGCPNCFRIRSLTDAKLMNRKTIILFYADGSIKEFFSVVECAKQIGCPTHLLYQYIRRQELPLKCKLRLDYNIVRIAYKTEK